MPSEGNAACETFNALSESESVGKKLDALFSVASTKDGPNVAKKTKNIQKEENK